MPKDNTYLLLEIAKKIGLYSEQTITTISMASELSISQQSVSRKLRELEKLGYIERTATVNGLKIKLKKKAIDKLKSCFAEMKQLFSASQSNSIKGIVVSGLGEGRFYTELRGYKRQFISKLNINPFPGTLNLKVAEAERERFLSNRTPILIDAFRGKNRTFGWIWGYPVTIGKIKAAAVIPERTLHKLDTLELISKNELRKTLKLKDGDEVIVKWVG